VLSLVSDIQFLLPSLISKYSPWISTLALVGTTKEHHPSFPTKQYALFLQNQRAFSSAESESFVEDEDRDEAKPLYCAELCLISIRSD
jgi:hypothetical protein